MPRSVSQADSATQMAPPDTAAAIGAGGQGAGPGRIGSGARRAGGWVGRLFQEQGLLVVILVLGLVMTQLSDAFLTQRNIINVLYQSTILATFAIGMTFVILTAGIDLSVGAIASMTSVIAIGLVEKSGAPPVLALAAGIAVGVVVGLINGLAIARIGIPPLIATLATFSAGIGAAYAYSDGAIFSPVPGFYTDVADARVAGVPVFIPAVLVLAILAHVVLTRTRFGRSVYAVGGNVQAARLAGIRTDRVVVSVYVIAGVLAAVAGLMLTARLATGSPRVGEGGVELTVIAAVVIGGTSLFGGSGNILGTLLGVLLITMVTNAINLLGVPSAYDKLVTGGIIFAAAALDVYRHLYTQRVMARRTRVLARREETREEASGAGA